MDVNPGFEMCQVEVYVDGCDPLVVWWWCCCWTSDENIIDVGDEKISGVS